MRLAPRVRTLPYWAHISTPEPEIARRETGRSFWIMLPQMTQAPEFLTTKEVAALLRVRERKVYELAATGTIPCRKVTGKLLFPTAEIEAWIAGEASPTAPPRAVGVSRPTAPAATAPLVFLGSHDPLLEWTLRAAGCDLPTLFGGSLDGLERLAQGQGAAAAIHIYDPASGDWNRPAVAEAGLPDRFVLIAFAARRQGLVHAKSARMSGLGDLSGRKIALRQTASGGRVLFEALLAQNGLSLDALDLAAEEARSEDETAEMIADGRAEAALGLEAMARRHGLGFAPLIEERFDLLIDRRAYFEAPFQRLAAFLRSGAFRARAESLGGYDVADCGATRWNGG